MPWWEQQEQIGYFWHCGVCGQRTRRRQPAPAHKPGCPYIWPPEAA